MRVGLALSAIVHLAVLLVAYVGLASPRLFAPTPTELMTVDIVPADEAPADEAPPAKPELKIDLPTERLEQKADRSTGQEAAPDPAAAEAKAREAAKPDAKETKTAAKPEAKEAQTQAAKPDAKEAQTAAKPGTAPSPPQQQPAPGQQMAANPAPAGQPDPFAPDAVPKPLYFPMVHTPDSWASDFDFDALADVAAALTRAEIAALRDHLEKCWKPPAALAQAPRLQAVLRIMLKPNGAMAAEPILVKASASAQGPALVDTATRALTQCQPFDFLPADKYSEWKILELSFTPRGLGG